MAGASKDLIIATVILIGCVLLLLAAFGAPVPEDSSIPPREPLVATNATPTQNNSPTGPRLPVGDTKQPLAVNTTRVLLGEGLLDEPSRREPVLADIGGGEALGVREYRESILEVLSAQPQVPVQDTRSSLPVNTRPSPGPSPGISLTSDPKPPSQLLSTPPTPPTTAKEQTYIVAEGDELMKISFKYYQTHQRWRELAAANPQIDPDALVPGTKLVIPAIKPAPTGAQPPPSSGATTLGARQYIVKEGDTYYDIARDQLGAAHRYQELERLNGKPGESLRPGDVLTLPAAPERGRPPVSPAPGAASTQTTAAAGGTTHVVAEGEYLSDISKKYYNTTTAWQKIATANGISDPNKLRVGQRLQIPDAAPSASPPPPAAAGSRSTPPASATPASATPASAAPASATPSGSGSWHTVQKGHTLQEISRIHYGTTTRWPELLKANTGVVPERMKAGDRIWVPGGRAAPATASPRSTTPSTVPAQPSTRTPATGTPAWPLGNERNDTPGNRGLEEDFFRR